MKIIFVTVNIGSDNGLVTSWYKKLPEPKLIKVSDTMWHQWGNTLRPKQNGRHFADDIFKWIFLNENVWIPIKISLKFVLQGPINNIPALVQIMAWRQPGDKPLSGPMMVRLPTHICITGPQWVKLRWSKIKQWKSSIARQTPASTHDQWQWMTMESYCEGCLFSELYKTDRIIRQVHGNITTSNMDRK